MKKMHFQNLQDRHRLCIFNITLFAYDFLFEQQGNSHEKYLMNKSTSNQGARHDHCPSSGAVKSIQRISQKAKKPGANLRLSHLGHSNDESCLIKHLLGHDKTLLTGAMILTIMDGDDLPHPANANIVKRYYA